MNQDRKAISMPRTLSNEGQFYTVEQFECSK